MYGDVDAGKVVEATRKVYPALDTMMEVQRKVLGFSTNVMEEMRKKAVTRQAANETQLPKATMKPSQKVNEVMSVVTILTLIIAGICYRQVQEKVVMWSLPLVSKELQRVMHISHSLITGRVLTRNCAAFSNTKSQHERSLHSMYLVPC